MAGRKRLDSRSGSASVRYHARRRAVIVDALGGKCVRCGFSDPRALQIDHVHGGGVREIRSMSGYHTYYLKVIESVALREGKYQLLCANCNWIKRAERGEERKRTGG